MRLSEAGRALWCGPRVDARLLHERMLFIVKAAASIRQASAKREDRIRTKFDVRKTNVRETAIAER
jgi:hypothetical protein